jgi:hypothetical protein
MARHAAPDALPAGRPGVARRERKMGTTLIHKHQAAGIEGRYLLPKGGARFRRAFTGCQDFFSVSSPADGARLSIALLTGMS